MGGRAGGKGGRARGSVGELKRERPKQVISSVISQLFLTACHRLIKMTPHFTGT